MNPLFNFLKNIAVRYATQRLKDPEVQRKIAEEIGKTKTAKQIGRKLAEKTRNYTSPPPNTLGDKDPLYYAGVKAGQQVAKVQESVKSTAKKAAKIVGTIWLAAILAIAYSKYTKSDSASKVGSSLDKKVLDRDK